MVKKIQTLSLLDNEKSLTHICPPIPQFSTQESLTFTSFLFYHSKNNLCMRVYITLPFVLHIWSIKYCFSFLIYF